MQEGSPALVVPSTTPSLLWEGSLISIKTTLKLPQPLKAARETQRRETLLAGELPNAFLSLYLFFSAFLRPSSAPAPNFFSILRSRPVVC